MNEFIDTQAGMINLSSVVRIIEQHDRWLRIEYRDYAGEPAFTKCRDGLHKVGGVVVPANPGFFVLAPVIDEKEDVVAVDRNPVVAWRVNGSDVSPLCVDGPVTETTILRPDGEVVDPFLEAWGSEAGWLESVRTRMRTKAAERAAAMAR